MSLFRPLMFTTVLAATVLSAGAALAGTPYTCDCDGKSRRFIGSTYGCEISVGLRIADIRSGKARRCTFDQKAKWREDACASNKCKAIPISKPY